jgi:nuclear cap-binding protein subunit 2
MSNDGASVELSSYRDQHFKGTRYEQEKLLKGSATLYVGNLGESQQQTMFAS